MPRTKGRDALVPSCEARAGQREGEMGKGALSSPGLLSYPLCPEKGDSSFLMVLQLESRPPAPGNQVRKALSPAQMLVSDTLGVKHMHF